MVYPGISRVEETTPTICLGKTKTTGGTSAANTSAAEHPAIDISQNKEQQTALTYVFFFSLQGPLHFCFTLQVNKDATLEEGKVQLSIMWGTHNH